ncbi:hypothetical protein T10_11679 [Trichinella papuae]|uniref:Uncharacterized protein n=1 Tax=Trichinella papuae TaxID=268474 RepID=A0A0V1LWM7_9BILA|nr:hypothetical protein T10_5332 [Trichinella papuae]KRZ64955.1 hypothetical protein T10_11679 [Trichinella papuae]
MPKNSITRSFQNPRYIRKLNISKEYVMMRRY